MMTKTYQKGIIFSTDAMLAFSITLLMILGFAIALGNYSERMSEKSESFFLEEKTFMVADSFVKNYNSENTMLGACIVDYEKKRVKSNWIDSTNFEEIKQVDINGFFVKEIVAKSNITEKTPSEKHIFLDNFEGKNCLKVERFVLIDGEKAIIQIEGCLK